MLITRPKHLSRSLSTFVAIAVAVLTHSIMAQAAPKQPKAFGSPSEAATALVEAAKAKDQKMILDILGPSYSEWILSGDPVLDAQAQARFVDAYAQKSSVTMQGTDKATLLIGNDDFPFPFPIVKRGDRWSFDSEAGKEELLNRRIGRNELNTIEVLRAIVDAQREYATRDRDDDGAPDYAQKFISSPGKKDGLYWPTAQGEAQSPLGPLVADAARRGYQKKSSDTEPVPYHGYYFRILRSQGAHASGGTYDYVVKGKMIGGFAVIAYPARYDVSGIKTFLINHDGQVYERDLGPSTSKAAAEIGTFDPDSRWKEL
ncbi:MAG: DUF2950 domain-containing protein [Pseudorhodoplanes sp.]|nr:MAG: DUF2950 domain-containing protein [Pseudorhodoplanes sp.]